MHGIFFFFYCVVIVIQAVEYFISATALKRCRFGLLGVTREVWGNSANAACINPHPFVFFFSFFFFYAQTCSSYTFIFLRYKGNSNPALSFTVTKPHGDFDSLKREQDYSYFMATQRAECVCLRRERVSWGERGNEFHACVGSGFGRVWN